jgi:hypothetical protein
LRELGKLEVLARFTGVTVSSICASHRKQEENKIQVRAS